MTAQPKPQPAPICAPETVAQMRWVVGKYTGQITTDQVRSLCDSHEELRRRLTDLIEAVGPVTMAWTDPAAVPARTNAVQAEWPHLACVLDELADVPRKL